jgi:hypothetical protein
VCRSGDFPTGHPQSPYEAPQLRYDDSALGSGPAYDPSPFLSAEPNAAVNVPLMHRDATTGAVIIPIPTSALSQTYFLPTSRSSPPPTPSARVQLPLQIPSRHHSDYAHSASVPQHTPSVLSRPLPLSDLEGSGSLSLDISTISHSRQSGPPSSRRPQEPMPSARSSNALSHSHLGSLPRHPYHHKTQGSHHTPHSVQSQPASDRSGPMDASSAAGKGVMGLLSAALKPSVPFHASYLSAWIYPVALWSCVTCCATTDHLLLRTNVLLYCQGSSAHMARLLTKGTMAECPNVCSCQSLL